MSNVTQKQSVWRFQEGRGDMVRIHKDGNLYATWTAENGLSPTGGLISNIRRALAEGAARFHVLGPDGLKTVRGLNPVADEPKIKH